jgi:hypothetical protein
MRNLFIFLSLLLSIGAIAQSTDINQYQSELMSEYQSLMTEDKFNQDRINEIETIALENPYYDLRQWIALSYITKSDVRELNSENFKKAFNILHKSIKENFFKSIPLAIYATKQIELRVEREEFIKTLDEKVSLGYLSSVPLAELYILNNNYDAVFKTLGALKTKQLGIFYNRNSQEVLNVLPSSTVSFLEKGDKILYIDNELVSFKSLSEILSRYKTNSEQEITFERDGEVISRNFIIPEDKFNINTAAHTMLFRSFSNEGFVEDDALDFLADIEIQKLPSFPYYKNLLNASLCHFYLEDDLSTNDKTGLELCRNVADGYIGQFESLKNSMPNYSITDYEFYSEIGDRTQYLIYKTTLHHIISEANDMYYGFKMPQDKKASIDLLSKYFQYFTDNFHNTHKWASRILTEEHISGNLLDKSPEKAFEYSKNLFGEDERITKLLTALVLDGEVDVSESFLRTLIDNETVHKFLVDADLYDYVVYKSFFDIKPFDKGGIGSCELANKNERIVQDEFTQIIYSACVIGDEIEKPAYDITKFINKLSADGVSSGTYLIHKYNLDTPSYALDYKKQLEVLKLAKNQSKKNKKQKPTEFWLTEAPYLYFAFESMIDEDIATVSKLLKEEEEHQLALLKAKNQKEKQRLAKIRAARRQETMKNTGNFLVDVLEFTVKAVLVVGAVALAGDALEDSSPEVQQAFVDSLSGSLTNSSQTYSSKYNSYQCLDARNDLTSARRKLGLSNNLMGNMSCSNVGGSCMTRLPKQCYNGAASCRPGDYTCTSRENANYNNCQSQARIAVQNEKRRCEQRRQQSINQCNTRVNNNNRNTANYEIRQAQSKVNQYCY